jgi:hypothetical protein
MSLPVFADLDKSVQDLFKDDFDLKYALKVKAAAPYRVNVTQNTDFTSKGGKTSLNGKVSAKWAHESGFTLDKLEIKNDGSLVTESSLSKVYPGLKLEFKGDDSFKGDLGATYKCSAATVTSVVDLVEFSSVKASALGHVGPARAGGAIELKTGDKAEIKTMDVGLSYSLDDAFFALKTSNKFANYNASVSYKIQNKYTLGGLFSFSPEKSTFSGSLACGWSCCPNTNIKVKGNCDGVVAASLKQSLSKTCTVTGATELDIHDPAAFKIGLTATLG